MISRLSQLYRATERSARSSVGRSMLRIKIETSGCVTSDMMKSLLVYFSMLVDRSA